MRFWEASRRVDDIALLGLVGDRDRPNLLPEDDPILQPTDRLVVVAPEATPPRQARAIYEASLRCEPDVQDPVRALFIGWNDATAGVFDRLEGYLPFGSRIEVLADSTILDPGIPDWRWTFDGSFTHTKHRPDHAIGTIEHSKPNVIVVVGYSDGMSQEEADALMLLTLMTHERAQVAGET